MRPLLIALVLVLAPRLASAQAADALIDEGIALREQRHDAEALVRFERAHAITPSARALVQIALAEQALGRFVAAEAHLVEALAQSSDRFVSRNLALLDQALGEIRAHLGAITIRGPDGASVEIAGEARGALPLAAPLRVIAGRVAIVVRAPGHAAFSTRADVAPGSVVDVDAVLAEEVLAEEAVVTTSLPDPEIADAPPPPPARPMTWMLPTGIALAGAGVLGLAIGTGLAVLREDHAQARQTCSDLDADCRGRYQAALDAESGAIASFVIGGALAAGGAALIVIELLGLLPEETSADRASIACAPSALGAACSGRF